MKKPLQFFSTVAFLIIIYSSANAGKPAPKWLIKDPFEQKVFIANQGQYSLPGKETTNDILFGARQEGLNYYFTKSGIWIEHDMQVKRSNREIEDLKNKLGEKDEDDHIDKELEYKTVEEFHQINFAGANLSATILSSGEVKQYYNFTFGNTKTIKATAYKKITYKNLYQGIDMEIYFPDNKGGFEYSFIIHPGANVAQIKMQYPLNEEMHLTNDGNISITSDYGLFIDHAPAATQSSSQKIGCAFVLSKGTVSFKTTGYDVTHDFIIDPWVTVPVFTSNNKAFNVDWDNAGNVYAYGGSAPFQVLKFDSNGTLLWSSLIVFNSDLGAYSGFAVDKRSQSVYIGQGFSFIGAQMSKINQAGTQVAYFGGNGNFIEMWRVAFSQSANLVIAGGGGVSNPSYTGFTFDTTLTIATPSSIVPSTGEHDMCLITTDNFGNSYMALARSHNYPNNYNNTMFKLTASSLSPPVWSVNDNYKFWEVTTVEYNFANGFNGMTISDTTLYTYDANTLKKWGTTNGNLIDSVNINGDTTAPIYWGGLSSDTCGNVFLGSHDTIKEYNSSLSYINFIRMPNAIYDVNLGNNNLIYACGNGFVGAFKLTPHATSGTNFKICLGNSVSLRATGASNYSWSPATGLNIITGDSVVATPSVTTTYNVICTGSLSCLSSVVDTFHYVVTVNNKSLPTINVTPPTISICFGQDTILTGSGSGAGTITYKWAPFAGLNDSLGSAVTASPTVNTTYTVTGTDTNGCYGTAQSIVIVDTLPQLSVTQSNNFLCAGQSDTLVGSGQPSYQWSPSTGLSATTGDSVIATPAISTAYSVTVMGKNGCSNSTYLYVYVDPLPNLVAIPAAPAFCVPQNVQLTVSGAFQYQWIPYTSLSNSTGDTVIASPNITTTYTIVGTARDGCIDSITVVVTIDTPQISLNPALPSTCFGQTIALNAAGASTYQWSPATGLSATTGSNVTASPTITTSYTVIGVDSIGCIDSSIVTVTIDSIPDVKVLPTSASICLGQSVILNANGAATYLWTPAKGLSDTIGSSVTASPSYTTTYTITGTSSEGCSASVQDTVITVSPPNKPTITIKGDTLVSSASTNNQWYFNGKLIPGATSQTYIANKDTGWYTVEVINPANGCSNASDSTNYIFTGINQLSAMGNEISIFPNPTPGNTSIVISSSAKDVKDWSLQIIDVLGRTLYTVPSLSYYNVIEISELPSAVYFVTIISKNDRVVYPVIKQ